MWPGWATFAGSAVGSFLGGLRTGGGPQESACHCDCHISFEGLPEPSERVLALLGQQLERCGPGQLTCPPPAPCPDAPKCPAPKPAPAAACPERACEACEACTPCGGLPWWWLVIVAVGAFAAGAAVGVPPAWNRRRARAAPRALLDVSEERAGRVDVRGTVDRLDRGAGAATALPSLGANTPRLRRQLSTA